MKIKLFRKKEKCYYCMEMKSILVKSAHELICRDCYRKEVKILFEIFKDILKYHKAFFNYSQDQIDYFQSSNFPNNPIPSNPC